MECGSSHGGRGLYGPRQSSQVCELIGFDVDLRIIVAEASPRSRAGGIGLGAVVASVVQRFSGDQVFTADNLDRRRSLISKAELVKFEPVLVSHEANETDQFPANANKRRPV